MKATSEKHWAWRGDKVGYSALHGWVRRRLGIPRFCEGCGSENKKKYEWANISGEYKRDINDWIRLCTSCHRIFDGVPWFLEIREVYKGEDHKLSKLKNSDIPLIVNMLKEGLFQRDIAKKFGVAQNVIFNIKHGRSWTHISGIKSY